ncbi:Na(+)/H(+) exchange regulatory cofactor NHE-RF1-like isoform X2 [Gigantopelta aegis]|uniref:Na(+)/H(+) exchange regulatory cofactor NHE-RF1-like isoform X2 n=1 Tax=Gigantopelta aegis TaxID=1735272 RepID=UPI001B88B6C6|nr:Na(+)/H(+) exchange regulatory cofactor NHE-RF1-like isoform X2 [Gigantopelta aegis]
MSNGIDATLKPRLCHVIKWPDFNGYGFNLHAEKGKAGQYIGKVDEDSPAAAAGLKPGDRIVEVEGTNIGNENHQQVVGRIKAAGEEVQMLVVDSETDQHYKDIKKVVKGDLEEVVYIVTPSRGAETRHTVEEPIKEEYQPEAETTPPVPEPESQPEPEPEPEPVANDVHAVSNDVDSSEPRIRLCHMIKRPDFSGYGFNLHAERDKPGQFIGKIDDDSPAYYANLHEGDRIVEVNGENIESRSHQDVIGLIKQGGEETKLLVLDPEADKYYTSRSITVNNRMPQVDYKCSRQAGASDSAEPDDLELPPAKAMFSLEDDEDEGSEVPDERPSEPAAEELVAESVAVSEELPPAHIEDETTVNDALDEPPAYEAPEDEPQAYEVPADEVHAYEAPADEFDAYEAPADEAYAYEAPADEVHAYEAQAELEVTENGKREEFTQGSEVVENTETSAPDEEVEDEPANEPEPEPVVPEPEEIPKTVNGQASYVENTTQNEMSTKPEPTPAPVPQAQTNGDAIALSAKEYRERLASKKKPDPRRAKIDFRSKYDMFQQM